MVHYNTTNQSFIYMHKILKEMGIKNNTFMLQVYDSELINIDPLSDNLTNEQKARVHYEITRNIWYFFREIVRIPSTGNKLRFELNRGNMAIIWAFSLNIDFSCLLPRQSYKSYTIDACYNWLTYWGSKNSNAIFIANRKPVAVQNLERVKEVADNLPEYLDLRRKFYDKDNVNRLTFEPGSYVNRIDVTASAVSEDHANKIGRGLSTREQFYDEVAFINYVSTIYSAAIYAYSTVARMAEREGESHHIIMATTAGSKLKPHGLWAYNTFYSSAQFTDTLYDMTYVDADGCVNFDRDKVKEYIRYSTQKFDMIHIEFMYYDLSKGDAYLDEMRKLSDTEQAFNREVLNQWDDDVEDHPLGNTVLQRVRSSLKSPLGALAIDKVYMLNLYAPIDWIKRNSDRIVIGMDCSTNTGGDFSTYVAVHIGTREVVATLRANNYNIHRYAYAVMTLLNDYFPKSTAVIERNHVGSAIIDILVSKSPNLRRRVYMAEDGKYGVVTTGPMRNQILYGTVFTTAFTDFGHLVKDKYIIEEVTNLIRTPSGKIDHRPGMHDDMVFAYLYAQWFCSFCKLKNRYYNALYFNTDIYNSEGDITVNNYKLSLSEKSVHEKLRSDFERESQIGVFNDVYYGDINRKIAELREKRIAEAPQVTVNEFTSDGYPEMTGNTDNDLREVFADKVDKAFDEQQKKLVKTSWGNGSIKKYLKYMSDR